MAFVLDVNLAVQQVLGLEKVKAQLAGATGAGAGRGTTVATPVGIEIDQKDLSNINALSAAAKKVNTNLSGASKSANNFGQQIFLAGKRYAAFVAATAVPIAAIALIREATQSIIEFDQTLVGLSQVLGTTVSQLGPLRQEMLALATATGTSQQEISQITKTLSQAGLRIETGLLETLGALARVPLVATFEDVGKTTDTVLAALNQFNDEALTAEDVLNKLTNVSKAFAVSAEDLGIGVQRAGGAFAAVGGNFDELIAALTTIRSVTREAASVVGTSLRTLTTRLRRASTIRFLEGFDIQVRDLRTGELLPFLETIGNIAERFGTLDTETKNLVATQLGGFRQISRAFALLRRPDVFAEALERAQNPLDAFVNDAERGLESVAARFGQLRGRFDELVQSLAEPVFLPLLESALALANAILGIGQALGPVLPLFLQFATFGVALKGIVAGFSALSGILKTIGGLEVFALLRGTGGAGGVVGQVGGGLAGAGAGVGAGAAAGVGAVFGRLANTTRQLVQSQLGQIAIAGGVTIALGKLEESANESGNANLEFTAATLKTITALTLFTSLLSGRSITSLISTLGGTTTALGTFGAAISALISAFAVAGTISGVIDASNIQTELENKVSEALAGIDIGRVSPEEDLGEAASSLIADISSSISQAAEGVDPSTGIGAAFSALGNRINDLLSGSFGEAFGRFTIDTREIQQAIDESLSGEEARDQLRSLLAQSISQFGGNFEEGLIQAISEFSPELAGAARPIVESLVNAASSTDIAVAQERAARIRQVAQQQNFIDEQRRIVSELSNISIPTSLSSDLRSFASAVSQTVGEVDRVVSDFSALSSAIGQIGGPGIETEINTEAIVKALLEDGLSILEDIPGIQRLNQVGQDFFQVANLTNRFIDNLLQTNIVDRLSDVETDSQEAALILNNALDQFATGIQETEGISNELASRLIVAGRSVVQNAISALREGEAFSIDREAILDGVRSAFGPTSSQIAESFVSELEVLLEAAADATNARLEASTLVNEALIERARATGQEASALITSLESLGLVIGQNTNISDMSAEQLQNVGGSLQFLFDTSQNTGEVVRRVSTSLDLANSLLDRFAQASQNEADARRAVSEAQRTNASNLGELQREFSITSGEAEAVRIAMTLFNDVLQQAPSEIDKLAQEEINRLEDQGRATDAQKARINELAEAEKERINIVTQAFAGQFRLIQSQIAAQEAQRLEPENIFRDAVGEFRQGVSDFINGLPTTTPVGGDGVGQEVQVTPSIVTIQSGEVKVDGQIAGEDISRVLQRAGFGATLDELDTELEQALRNQLGFQQRIQAQLQAFDQGLERIDFGILSEVLSPVQIQEAIQEVIDVLRERAGRELGGAFTLGEDQLRNLETNLRLRIESLIGEGIQFELQLSEDARRIIEGGIGAGDFGQVEGVEQFRLFNEQIIGASESLGSSAETLDIGAQSIGEASTSLNQSLESLSFGAESLTIGSLSLENAAGLLNSTLDTIGQMSIEPGGTNRSEEIIRIQDESKQAIEKSNTILEQLRDNLRDNLDQLGRERTDIENAIRESRVEEAREILKSSEKNTEALQKTSDELSRLDQKLSQTNQNIGEGIDLNVDAVQSIIVDVRGLRDAVSQLEPQFQRVAQTAAQIVVANALRQIASAAGDNEFANALGNVANNLA